MRDAEGLKELFEPFAPVSLKRMFSGYGIYADGVCFALNLRGDVFLKVDEETEPRFAAAGSEPFVYGGHRGKVTVMSYWRLVSAAYDDPDELKSWCGLAMAAARRAAALKQARSARRIAKAEARPKKASVPKAADAKKPKAKTRTTPRRSPRRAQ